MGLSLESFLQRQLALAFKCRNQSTHRKCQCKENSSKKELLFALVITTICVLAYLNYVF